MNLRFLNFQMFLLIAVIILRLSSVAVQATEYKEVNTEVRAEEILKHIEYGDNVNLDNCRIVGGLNLNKIELKTIPNPVFDRLRKEGNDIEDIKDCGVNESSEVIKSNIIIVNSTFENTINFSNVLFKNPVSFKGTNFTDVDFRGVSFSDNTTFEKANFGGFATLGLINFGNYTNFIGTKFSDHAIFCFSSFGNNTNFYTTDFGDSANFVNTTFDYYTVFSETTFGDNSSFENAKFGDYAIFAFANFGNSTDFMWTSFRDHTIFEEASFGKDSNFGLAKFGGSVNFDGVNFGNSANFLTANFNDTAEFVGPYTPENVIVDGEAYEVFRKGYENQARYDDADIIYYNYRKMHQESKSLISLSKWIDILSWITCGYGMKPSYSLYFGGFIVFLFSIIYQKGPTISLEKPSNKIMPFKLNFQNGGIAIRTEIPRDKQRVSFWDALNFSITTFTTVGYGNWYPKENFKKWATLEGLLGWITLGIFMSTLTRVIIRG